MLRYIHGSTFYLFFVLPKMEAPNFESIFECMGSIKFLFLFLFYMGRCVYERYDRDGAGRRQHDKQGSMEK